MRIKKRIIAAVLILTGAALIAAGLMRDEPQVILSRARVVCAECIGIG